MCVFRLNTNVALEQAMSNFRIRALACRASPEQMRQPEPSFVARGKVAVVDRFDIQLDRQQEKEGGGWSSGVSPDFLTFKITTFRVQMCSSHSMKGNILDETHPAVQRAELGQGFQEGCSERIFFVLRTITKM